MHEHWLVCPMHVLWRYNREACSGKECFRCTVRGGRPPQLWRYTGLLERALQSVDAFIAPSAFTRDKHLEFGLRVKAPIVNIPSFAPLPKLPAGDDVTPQAEPYFLYVGRLERIKGAHVVVDAFTRYSGAQLVLAGTGTDAMMLHAMAAASPHIRFLGQQDQSEITRLMRHAIALILPSVGYEVFPLTVLEANAQGTPVVGHRLGPVPEMLDGHGGVTYGDQPELIAALERLRSDSAHRNAMGERGRRRYLAEWTPDRHLARYLDLIDNLKSAGWHG